ncbi:hypothetical protein Tco_1109949 [Tanacetum coccineum]|uniref:Uncharacterized protein n=1 Tax=Tanacetum coccineum TaxID=301880 RepID=A0ABQ5IHV4_9ASTR
MRHKLTLLPDLQLLLIFLISFQRVLVGIMEVSHLVIDHLGMRVHDTPHVYDLVSLCGTLVDRSKQEIKHLKAHIKKLKKKAKPMQKESVSKQGRKPTKAEPIVHKDPAFDELDDDTMDYMETKELKTSGWDMWGRERSCLARDEEVARKVQEDWEAEEEVKKLAKEEATKAALSNEYDFIQARLNADKILAEKLQEEEREMYTIEQRAKFLHDTIAAQGRFLAQQRSEAIRNKPPLRNQLRNQMMTYLKHVGGKKHSDLKTKGFEEIKALYDKIKRSNDSFIAISSAKDEKVIKEMNEQVADASKKRVKKDSDKEVDYENLTRISYTEWISEYLTTKLQYDETKKIEDVYLNVVIRNTKMRQPERICQKAFERFDNHVPQNKYPLKKEVMSQLLKLKLETEEDELAIPEQTATSKGILNPLMAGSLPKTIKPTELDVAVLLKRQVADEEIS